MGRHFRRMALLGALVGLTGSLQGSAQDAAGAAPLAPAESNAADREGSDDPTRVIPQERWLEVAQQMVASMRNSLSKGLDELRDAREARDAVQLTCVNEQVTAMKGLLRVSQEAIVAMQEALTNSDVERARYEFRKINVSKRKMDDLVQAAVNCAGAENAETNTSVELEVDPSLTNRDPYYGDDSFFFDPRDDLAEGNKDLPGSDDPDVPRPPPASGVR